MKAACCALLLMLSTQAAAGEPAFDAAFDDVMTRYRLPGLAVGIVEDGEVVYLRTAGERIAGSGANVDSRTLFKIASNTKAMTAAVLARLVDAGKLRWDDPVVKHLPQFRMHDAWVTEQMQVRDLLIHNSGLPAGAGDLMLWPEPNTFTREDVIRGLAHLRPVDSFRSRYAYDNLLYIVAGEVAAAAGGAPYEQLVRREVLEPLGMHRCQAGEWRVADVGNVAQPHMRQSGRNVPVRTDGERVRPTTMEAAGGIRCSLDDMLLWVRAWLSPDAAPGWLSPAQRRTAWTVHMPMPISQRMRDWDGSHFYGYGYGWRLSDVDGVFKAAHTGTLMGMYSSVTMLPDRRVGIVMLSNGEADAARTVLTQALVKHYTARDPALTVAHYAEKLAAEDAARPASAKAPDTSRRRAARPAELAQQLGVYRDPWFGDVSICRDGDRDRVRLRAARSPRLDGIVQRVDTRWLVDWDDPSVDAEAWLHFAGEGEADLRMSKVDPRADFSFDYEDLAFERTVGCP